MYFSTKDFPMTEISDWHENWHLQYVGNIVTFNYAKSHLSMIAAFI
jgi:hypothetical protein